MGQGWRVFACGLLLATVAFACGGPPQGKLTLGLKYVSYLDSKRRPVVVEDQARGNLDAVNATWATCDIAFRLDEYDSIDPGVYGLRFGTRDLSELQDIRKAFDEPETFLLVTTGPWDRSGTLGSSAANAWTAMPAARGPFGAVLEENVGDFSAMIAHELGHYLGLSHVSDAHDVMNPIIYSYSKNLGADQCTAARAAVGVYWRRALR